jgi:hypothetical protein
MRAEDPQEVWLPAKEGMLLASALAGSMEELMVRR